MLLHFRQMVVSPQIFKPFEPWRVLVPKFLRYPPRLRDCTLPCKQLNLLASSQPEFHLQCGFVKAHWVAISRHNAVSRARTLLSWRDTVRCVGMHDDNRASRNGQHVYLERFTRDGVNLPSTPLLLNCVVGMRVRAIKEPTTAMITKKVGTTDNLERAVMFLEAVHIDCDKSKKAKRGSTSLIGA